ncbi:MAG TPA: ABC transporter permease, partial [Longimicrobiales bacterium]|nr:ABC transporter permease [Longimicrobiales bacterium]
VSMKNLKLAFRTLLKSPFVTTVAVISLALGIGANAAIFSLFDQMLLQPLPVAEPGRLVNLSAPGPKHGSTSCGQAGDCEQVFSYPMLRDLQQAQSVFTDIAAHVGGGANLAYQGQTMDGSLMMVSGSYFPVLGLTPAIGRLLGPDDDRTPGAHYVAVLSHAYWQNQLGGRTDVLGQSLVVNGQPMTIVGVAPRGFESTTLGSNPHVYVPLTMRGQMSPGWEGFENRRSYWAYLFARLKPGVTIEQARTALNGVYRPILHEVEAPLQTGMSEETMARFRAREIGIEPGQRGQSSIHTEARTPLVLLLSITAIVLLIACANIANLLLARGANRSMEMAVRLSLGASRGRILGQLLTESVVLGVLGGVASLLVARWTLAGIGAMMPPDAAQTLSLSLDGRVVLFAGVLGVATGVLFGLFPALHSTRPNLIATIRANTGQLSAARSAMRFRTGLVVAQIALSMALLASAGLFIRSLVNVTRVELGMDTSNVVTFSLAPVLNGYEAEGSIGLFARLEDELRALPGVTGVTGSMIPVLANSSWGGSLTVQGFEAGPDTDTNARLNHVGPGYFGVMGVPLLAGREFTDADVDGAPQVAIVNEAFTRKFDLGRDAVGTRFGSGRGADTELEYEIVGVVADSKYAGVKDDVPPLYFRPYRQALGTAGFLTFYVRSALPRDQVLRAVPPVVAQLDPNLPVQDLKTLDRQVEENIFMDRVISTLAAAFALLATLLAAVGLYGVLAFTVAQRTREIGVRMALGAPAGRVRAMVLRQVGWVTVGGGMIGLLAALGLGKLAGSLLYGLEGTDPLTLVGAALVLGAVALGAGYLPAARASKIDPMLALRHD